MQIAAAVIVVDCSSTCVVCDSIRPQLNEFSTESETVTFVLDGAWAAITTLNVWYTRFGWDGMTQTNSTFFEHIDNITVVNGQFSLTVNPDELYSITTLGSPNKADISTPPASTPFPSSYADNFDSYPVVRLCAVLCAMTVCHSTDLWGWTEL